MSMNQISEKINEKKLKDYFIIDDGLILLVKIANLMKIIIYIKEKWYEIYSRYRISRLELIHNDELNLTMLKNLSSL